MILPVSNQATLLLLVVSLVCWGSWANTQKAAGKWRFELYYYDFALGFLLTAAGAAFTLGSLNSSELSFQENFLIAGYRNMAYAFAAGMVFNFGTMFLSGTISFAGLSVAFPVASGVAIIVSSIFALLTGTPNSVLLTVSGGGLVVAAIAVAAYTYSTHLDALAEAAKTAGMQMDPRSKQAKRAPQPAAAAKAVVLGALSGIALGLFHPLVDLAQETDAGVAPYGLALLFAGGILSTTVVMNPFLFNFPISGGPIRLSDYFRGTLAQHLLGLSGGALAGAALLASFIASGVPGPLRAPPGTAFALNQSAAVLAALWGFLAWRELKGPNDRVRMLFAVMLVLYGSGIAVLSVGQG